ncbi:MAG TPA: flagellar basal body P-ring formation chaperone FlgA [Gemmatimonadales bacterium]
MRIARTLAIAVGLPALMGVARPAPAGAGGGMIPAASEGFAGDAVSVAPFHRGGPPALAAAETVLVAKRDLPRGVAITVTDVDVVVTASASTRARGGERPGLGWVTRRVVRAGEALRPPTVAPPPVVHAGGPVTVVWIVDGIRVTREGTALGTALAGERVVVRVDAQRRVTGTVTGPGLVTVDR